MIVKLIMAIVSFSVICLTIMLYFGDSFGVPFWIIFVEIGVLFLYYVIFNIKFWRFIAYGIDELFKYKRRWVTLFISIFLIVFHFSVMKDVLVSLNPHDYIPGRDKPITSHVEQTDDSGDTIVVVDSWYDPYREYHKYIGDSQSQVQWKDMNNQWHTTTIHRYVLWVFILYGFIIFICYKKLKSIDEKDDHDRQLFYN